MVLYAISLHFLWAVFILIDPAAIDATAVSALHRFIQPPLVLAFVIALASILATIGIFSRKVWVSLLLMPQQILLMVSASGAIEAMWIGQFADGVTRPAAFIAADQIYSVLAAIGHTVAIIVHAKRLMDEESNGG